MAEEQTDFDYKPDAGSAPTKASDSITWSASEYIEHFRGKSWYVLLAGGTVVLAAATYLLTKDVFAAAIILVLGIIVASVAHRKPRQVEYSLTARGISAGEKSYSYKEFRSFSVVRDGPLSSLVLVPLKRFSAPISIFFEAEQEDSIVALLGEHLPMEQRVPDRVDALSRRLRF